MPLVAIHQPTGQRVVSTELDRDPRLLYKPGELVCPICEGQVHPVSEYVRGGFKVIAHFRHNIEQCSENFDRHPESMAHLSLKQHLASKLRDLFAKDSRYASQQIAVDIEVPIAMDWRERGRVADVMVTWPNGWQDAHEIQLAYITLDDLKERTDDYRKAGITCYWYFGIDNRRDDLESWCVYEYCGWFGIADAAVTPTDVHRSRNQRAAYVSN